MVNYAIIFISLGGFVIGLAAGALAAYVLLQIHSLKQRIAEMQATRLTYSQVDGTEEALALGMKIRREINMLEAYHQRQTDLLASAESDLEILETVQKLLRKGAHEYSDEKVHPKLWQDVDGEE